MVRRDGTRIDADDVDAVVHLAALAAAGNFFEGFVVFMTGVALPLLARDSTSAPAEDGIIGAASLFGILIGAVALGGLADHFGRKRMFVTEMIIFTAFFAILMVCRRISFRSSLCLFGLGLALGCDYPTAHMIISENTPSRGRGRLVLAAFAFQAVGALAGTGVGYLVLRSFPHSSAWRWMYAIALLPALVGHGRAAFSSRRARSGSFPAARWRGAKGVGEAARTASRAIRVPSASSGAR